MKFDFYIQKVQFAFNTFGTAEVNWFWNGEKVENFTTDIKKINKVKITFTKTDPADVSSYADVRAILINGFDLKEKFKTLEYNIDTNKHNVEQANINNNLYLGYEGSMEFTIEHRNDPLAKAAWTIAYTDFTELKWPLKGEQYREKNFHNVHRDTVFLFTGCHPPNTKEVLDEINELKIGHLDTPLHLPEDKQKIQDWINKSSRINISNFDSMEHFTISNGTTESLNSFILSRDEIYMPEKTYYHHGEVLEGKKITVKNVFADDLKQGSNVLFEFPSPWYSADDMNKKIVEARSLNCRIALDLTWLPVSTVPLDLDLSLVDEVYFSMNKCWPIVPLRPAVRWSKNRIPDSQTFDNETCRYTKVPINAFMKLIDKFSFDFTYDKYKDKHKSLCEQFSLLPTKVLWFTRHPSAKHDDNHYISKHYYLDDFVCINELLNHRDKYFW